MSWKKTRPLRILCIRRSHTGEGSRETPKPFLNLTEGVFYYRLVVYMDNKNERCDYVIEVIEHG
jgi:hypothetical protein